MPEWGPSAGGLGLGLPGGALRLVGLDVVEVPLGEADVVQALEQPPAGVVLDLERKGDRAVADLLGLEVDRHLQRRVLLDGLPERLDVLLRQDDGEQAGLSRVVAEDVAEPRADDDPETAVEQRPDGVLAGRAGAEVGAGHQDRGVGVLRQVEHELGLVGAPGAEQAVLEAGAGDPLEVLGRDDLVGVDVAPPQRGRGAGVRGEGVHGGQTPALVRAGSRSAGAVRWPVRAVAAATAGDTRWVRPPLPWRPWKLRLLVDADRSPGLSWSGFMPRHIEQPAPRHSAPASRKTWSRPSASACALTPTEPGTTRTRVSGSTFLPRSSSATTRRSSIRPLVQEPTKTVSTLISRSGVPGFRPM